MKFSDHQIAKKTHIWYLRKIELFSKGAGAELSLKIIISKIHSPLFLIIWIQNSETYPRREFTKKTLPERIPKGL